MRSAATVRVELDGAHNRFVELRSSGALQLRPTPKGLFVVGGAAGPVGGDRFELDIDIGPGAGDEGGLIVAQGPPAKVAKSKKSRTAPFLFN